LASFQPLRPTAVLPLLNSSMYSSAVSFEAELYMISLIVTSLADISRRGSRGSSAPAWRARRRPERIAARAAARAARESAPAPRPRLKLVSADFLRINQTSAPDQKGSPRKHAGKRPRLTRAVPP
jgi:hypothetical protein